MALIESQLDSTLPQLKEESSPGPSSPNENSRDRDSPGKKPKMEPNGDIYGLDQGPALPLSVDYRSPVSHFVPPAVEIYTRHKQGSIEDDGESSQSPSVGTPPKRKRGRPRVDKTSPEYLAKSAARKQAKIAAAASMPNSNNYSPEGGEKRKRGRPRVDKTSPEYLARKRAREIEALERKAKREYKRRSTADSAASSSTGETTPRAKRKYTKRMPSAKKDSPSTERVKGKRGRPRKVDANSIRQQQQAKIRVRSNLMPTYLNAEPISVESDDSGGRASPGRASDSLSLDENLRALQHIHEKYANIDKDDLYGAHLLAANFKKPPHDQQRLNRDDDEVLSIRSSEGRASVKELDTRVEKLEDSSGSDSDSSSSGSGSSSSSSSSSSSGSSSSSDSSDSESDTPAPVQQPPVVQDTDSRSFGAWSHNSLDNSESGSDIETSERLEPIPRSENDDISESENESPDKSFQCHICKKWYSTRVTLKIHRRVHQNKGGSNSRSRMRSSDRYECEYCNETFNRREKLWEHQADAHRGSMTVRCEVCHKCFEDDAELAEHDRTHTDDERAGRCGTCGLAFPRPELLRRHVRAHGAPRPPHACLQCGKRFTHAHSLTRHMHNHANQLYRCVVCKSAFARADQLAQHLNSHLANYKRLKP